MNIWTVIASGQSLTYDDVEYVRMAREAGVISGVVAISNVGLDIAPWADVLVSHDVKWWMKYPDALNFNGRKFCRQHYRSCEVYIPNPSSGCNSGYMGMQVVRDIFQAEKIILLGFDMQGTHYFGPHTRGLKNSSDEDFKRHLKQFRGWYGPEVVNCTPASMLEQFPFQNLRDVVF